MYAIRNRKTKKWVYGTDYRYSPRRQRTSFDRALTYEDYDHAKLAFVCRQCGKDYEVVPVVITEARGESEVIRCKDCVHCAYDWNGNQPMFTCELGIYGGSVDPYYFCSYAEQRGEEE